MKLPGGEDVFIDERKLTSYALVPNHPRGGHKARVFRSALGLLITDAPALLSALRAAAAFQDAERRGSDEYGTRYRLRFEFRFGDRSAMLVSGWVVPLDGRRTYLASVFVDTDNA